MKPRTTRRPVRFVPAIILPALALLLAAPTTAFALGDWVGAEGSYWHQSQTASGQIDGDIFGGTNVDFQDTLNLDRTDNTVQGRVWFRWSKTRLVFDYFDSTRSGDTTLSQSFVFNDTIYTAGQNLQSDFEYKLMQGKFLFSVLDLKLADVGVGFGVNEAKIKLDLNGSISGQASLDQSVPYPTLAAYATLKPAPGFHIKAELEGIQATVSGTRVHILDARVQAELYIAHIVGLFAGYRQYRFDVTDNDFGSFNNTFKGPFIGVGVKF